MIATTVLYKHCDYSYSSRIIAVWQLWHYVVVMCKLMTLLNVNDNYSMTSLQVHTCHKRGAHAMGGMAAQIPVKNNPALQEEAMGKVKEDKVYHYYVYYL